MSQAALARRARCSASTITALLDGSRKQSPAVPRIERALGMPPTFRQDQAEIRREMATYIDGLSDEEVAIAYGAARTALVDRRR